MKSQNTNYGIYDFSDYEEIKNDVSKKMEQ